MNQQKTGFAKGDAVLFPMNPIDFPSVRPKMIGSFDAKI